MTKEEMANQKKPNGEPVMDPAFMKSAMEDFFAHLMSLCEKKNRGYAQTDVTGDALHNFRQAEQDWDVSMMRYAGILQGKHIAAWKTWVRTGEAPDKPWRILGDIAVYCFLKYCIGIDQGDWTHKQVMEDVAE